MSLGPLHLLLGRRGLVGAAVILVAVKLWLTRGQSLLGIAGSYFDDRIYLTLASYLTRAFMVLSLASATRESQELRAATGPKTDTVALG